jgi:hypothetical protein
MGRWHLFDHQPPRATYSFYVDLLDSGHADLAGSSPWMAADPPLLGMPLLEQENQGQQPPSFLLRMDKPGPSWTFMLEI